MFNIGGDDKEKLEENMEEIKQLVNESKDEPEEVVDEESKEQEKDSVGDLEGFDQPEPDQDLQQDENETPEVDGMQNDLENLQSQVQQNVEEQKPEPQEEEPIKEQVQETEAEESINTTQTRSSQPVPDERGRDEVKELKDEIEDHISSIEKGRSNRSIKEDVKEINQEREEEEKKQRREEQPLFLDVESFEDIREMVEEMHYLTTEMDDIMEHLVVGVEEDQETVKEAGQVIQEFQTRRNNIEETLKQN